LESSERSTSQEGASAVGRKEVGRDGIHDEGEEDGRVEEVALRARSRRMRIHPSVEAEAARGRVGVSGAGHEGHCPGHGGSSNVGGPVP
jgi:hypothetical protein